MSDTDYDVIIAGGGPGGSTAAALLAEHGHRVLLLEKETFPRFHIGESLLPAELPLFARLGFDAAALPAVYKEGADFLDEATGDFAHVPQDIPGGPLQLTWNRSEQQGLPAVLAPQPGEGGGRRPQGGPIPLLPLQPLHAQSGGALHGALVGTSPAKA